MMIQNKFHLITHSIHHFIFTSVNSSMLLKFTGLQAVIFLVLYLSIRVFCHNAGSSLVTFSTSNIPIFELDALHDLYTSTNGAKWRQYGVAWDFTEPDPNPCAEGWYGLVCMPNPYNASQSLIQTINLFAINLVGTLPTSIGNFTLLQSLVLNVNSLTGSIPSTITNLTSLISLDLGTNKLVGTIPKEIGNLVFLQTLSLSGNYLAGSLPHSLCDLILCKSLLLDQNSIFGSLPECIGNMSSMVVINLSYNDLSGSLPESMHLMTNLTTLYMYYNKLNGSIPVAFGLIKSLNYIILSNNDLSVSIPSFLSNLTQLNTLSLSYNRFTGSLTAQFLNFPSLQYLELNNNYLNGSIPNAISGLTSVKQLNLGFNDFTGTLPVGLYDLSNVVRLAINDMTILGSVSPLINQLTKLGICDFSNNYLTSTLPSTIGQLLRLDTFDISNNLIDGSLPYEMGNCSKLTTINIAYNMITNTIPESFSNLSLLQTFNTSYNMLSGSIPITLGAMQNKLYHVILDNNQLIGEIPHTLWHSISLLQLQLTTNHLTGQIVDDFYWINGRNYVMKFLTLSGNYLSGSVPETLYNMTTIIQFELDNNMFSGSLLVTRTAMKYYMETFFVNNNHLSGNLNHVFDSNLQPNLINIDVSDNQFTGLIPSTPFNITGLQSFAAVGNCFASAILPVEICHADNLLTLALDGLMTAASCANTHTFFPPWTNVQSYWLDSDALVEIPNCVFELPKLHILHLSGNSYTGRISSDLNISDTLFDLSISNNNLIGTTPSNIQYKTWQNLDLSFNKLGGTLRSDFPVYNSTSWLSLQVNRLSGEIPSNLKNAAEISILDGNLFSCDASRTSLPTHDNDNAHYECGSNTFNYSLYSWLAVMVCMFVGVVVVCYSYYFPTTTASNKPNNDNKTDRLSVDLLQGDNNTNTSRWSCLTERPTTITSYNNTTNIVAKIIKWLSVFHDVETADLTQQMPHSNRTLRSSLTSNNAPTSSNKLISLHQFGVFLTQYRLLCVIFTAFALFLMLPVNSILTSYFNTYTFEYAWILSSVYLSGVIPAVCILFAILLIIGVCGLVWPFAGFKTTIEQTTTDTSRDMWTLAQCCVLFVTVVVNIIVIVGVNVAYVYIHTNYSSNIVQIAQISVALFKVVWNNFVVRGVLKLNKQFIATNRQVGGDPPDAAIDNHISVSVLIMLFNNLAAPFLATAFVSSNCFYNVVSTPPSVVVSYLYSSCLGYSFDSSDVFSCTGYVYGADPKVTFYIPPFTYSYQCSSAFITTYASVYVFMFIIVAVAVPLSQCLIMYVYARTAKSSVLHNTITAMLPRILKPLDLIASDDINNNNITSNNTTDTTINPINTTTQSNNNSANNTINNANTNTWNKTALFSLMDVTFSSRLFDCDVFVVQLVNFLAVLMTFGVVVPPVALVACVSIFCVTYSAQVCIGRFVCHLTHHNYTVVSTAQFNNLLKSLEHDCSGAHIMFIKSLYIAVPFVVLFYSYLLFDILGDAVGWKQAMWMPISIFIVLLLVFIGLKLQNRLFGTAEGTDTVLLGDNKNDLTEPLLTNVN